MAAFLVSGTDVPIQSRIFTDEKLVFTKAYGVITGEDILQNQQRLVADPDFSRDYRQLWHAGGATAVKVNYGVMSQLQYSYEADVRRAIFTATTHSFGVGRMFETLRSDEHGGSLKVFKDLDAALEWIDLKPSVYARLADAMDLPADGSELQTPSSPASQ